MARGTLKLGCAVGGKGGGGWVQVAVGEVGTEAAETQTRRVVWRASGHVIIVWRGRMS
jgi:hypothetical protein